MKLKSIKKIQRYKSFQDFSWHKFFNNETFNDINILYGENGSGKTCICNILKSVSQNKNFIPNYKPEEVCLLFNDSEYKYSIISNKWNKRKNEDDILFFDHEFVDKNIHLGHNRNTQQGGQEQESGKMIIEFDSEAINLRDIQKKSKIKKDEQEKILQNFHNDNEEVLNFSLLNEEIKLFRKHKDESKEEIKKIKKELIKNKKVIEKKLETDLSLQKKVNDIQDSIEEIENEKIDILMSDYEDYQTIFNFDLKEQVKIEAEHILIKKLQLHKDFFETGIAIRKFMIFTLFLKEASTTL